MLPVLERVLSEEVASCWVPSGIAFGIGMYITPGQCLPPPRRETFSLSPVSISSLSVSLLSPSLRLSISSPFSLVHTQTRSLSFVFSLSLSCVHLDASRIATARGWYNRTLTFWSGDFVCRFTLCCLSDWTIPRVIGALVESAWRSRYPEAHNLHMLMVASGFVLGEGIMSIFALVLKSANAPTF